MAVPKRKTSPSRRGMRRSADALKAPTYIEDKDFGRVAPTTPHRSENRDVSRSASTDQKIGNLSSIRCAALSAHARSLYDPNSPAQDVLLRCRAFHKYDCA